MQVPRGFKLISIVILLPAVIWGAALQQARRVDEGALRDAGKAGGEWITYNLNWAEQRFSPLDQINASNVGRLGVAWSYEIPAAAGNPQNRQEGTPLFFNGV